MGALHGHTMDTTALVADLGEEQFYSSSADKSLKIWDVASRRPRGAAFRGAGSGQVHGDLVGPCGRGCPRWTCSTSAP